MNIVEETRQCYTRVTEYQKAINYPSPIGPIWKRNLETIFAAINAGTDPRDVINASDRTFMYSIDFPPENAPQGDVWRNAPDKPKVRDLAVDWLLAKQKQVGVDIDSMPSEIQESALIYDANKVTRNGRTLSGNFLRTLSIYCQIKKYLRRELNAVVELGGGCGHQARTLLLQEPKTKYTIFDIPETLCVSHVFLRSTFPDKRVIYVTCEKDLDNIDNYDLAFIPVVFADRLHKRKYDLFINTASMGEMPNNVIHYWVDYIQAKVTVGSMFVMNRFLNTVTPVQAQWRAGENRCSVIWDANWKVLQWEVEPIYARCPYMDPLHCRYLEIIAERPWDISEEEKEARAERLVEEVELEDWHRIRTLFGGGVMTARDNILVNDMTMSGPLFKLWESNRIRMTPRRVSLMIDYLTNRLTHTANRLEEVLFYEEVLRQAK